MRRSSRTRQGKQLTNGGFSSMSLGSIPKVTARTQREAPITPVTVNKSLLAPLNINVDPTIQVIRTEEKNQIKGLNDRFVTFIDKVRILEQQNKMLETKWKLLGEQKAASNNIEPMMQAYISNLQRQLNALTSEKSKLDQANNAMHKQVDDFKTKYEIEINKRNDAENEFVMIKKDVDCGFIAKLDLEEKLAGIADEVNFLKTLYNLELRELQDSLKQTSVVVQMDNTRDLDMDQIVIDVKAQYEEIASRNRAEAENWYQNKFDQMAAQAGQFDNELRSTKGEIAELNRMISRLQMEIQAAQGHCAGLEVQITEAERRGDEAVLDAKARIRDLEVAMQRAKQDMARQLREYQELMNLKLALDIEISTYRKLLEGEEDRVGQQSILNIQTVPNKGLKRSISYQQKPVLIKTVETQDRMYN